MDDIWRDVFEDLGLTEYYLDKITIEKARALARKRVVDNKDIPWCFIENVINPSYDGRSIFFEGQKVNGNELSPANELSPDNEDDFDWDTEINTEDDELYTFMDVAISVLSCCDNTCKQFLGHMLHKSQLSSPIVLPDITDKNKLIVQSSIFKGITQDVGFEGHIPIVSFLSVNGNPILKTKILNTLLVGGAHKPFYDRELEHSRMGGASQKKIYLDGSIDAALSEPGECTCRDTNICSCTFKKVLLFLNLYGFSRDFKAQENLICKISTLVTIIVHTGKLPGDSDAITNIKEIINKSKQTLVVFTKEANDSLDHCKKGVQELKDVISGTGAQVAVLYNRQTGHQDNMDLVRGNMKKKINVIMETIDSDNISLKEQFENLDIDNVTLDAD